MINSGFSTRRMSPYMATIFGYVGIVFFGFACIFIFFDLLTSKPALTINSDGIINNSHVGAGYLIRWKNIKSLRINSTKNQRMIEIDLKDNEEVFQQVNFLSRRLMKANGRFMGTPTFIPAVMIKMNLDDVLSIIQEQKKLNMKNNDV